MITNETESLSSFPYFVLAAEYLACQEHLAGSSVLTSV